MKLFALLVATMASANALLAARAGVNARAAQPLMSEANVDRRAAVLGAASALLVGTAPAFAVNEAAIAAAKKKQAAKKAVAAKAAKSTKAAGTSAVKARAAAQATKKAKDKAKVAKAAQAEKAKRAAIARAKSAKTVRPVRRKKKGGGIGGPFQNIFLVGAAGIAYLVVSEEGAAA